MPLPLEELEKEPPAEGDYYPGDLLASVVRSDRAYWESHPDLRPRIRQVVDRAEEALRSQSNPDFHLLAILEKAADLCPAHFPVS